MSEKRSFTFLFPQTSLRPFYLPHEHFSTLLISLPPETPSPVKWFNSASALSLETPLLSLDLPPSSGLAKHIAWHRKGDYLATVCKVFNGSHVFRTNHYYNSQWRWQGAVWIHQVSRRHSQAPFKKIKGSVQIVLFHPLNPTSLLPVRNTVSYPLLAF